MIYKESQLNGFNIVCKDNAVTAPSLQPSSSSDELMINIFNIEIHLEKFSFEQIFYSDSPDSNKKLDPVCILIKKSIKDLSSKLEESAEDRISNFFINFMEAIPKDCNSRELISTALTLLQNSFIKYSIFFEEIIKNVRKQQKVSIEDFLQSMFLVQFFTKLLTGLIDKEMTLSVNVTLVCDEQIPDFEVYETIFIIRLHELRLYKTGLYCSEMNIINSIAQLPNLKKVIIHNSQLIIHLFNFLSKQTELTESGIPNEQIAIERKQLKFYYSKWQLPHIKFDKTKDNDKKSFFDLRLIRHLSKLNPLQEIIIEYPQNYLALFRELKIFRDSKTISKITLRNLPTNLCDTDIVIYR